MNQSYVTIFDFNSNFLPFIKEYIPIIGVFFISIFVLPLIFFAFKPLLINNGILTSLIKDQKLIDAVTGAKIYIYYIFLIIILSSSALVVPEALFLCLANYLEYRTVTQAIVENRCKVIEGQIENLDAYDSSIRGEGYMDHAKESFDIKGVKFSYSPNVLTRTYHQVVDEGGVLTEGRWVRLTYIENLDENKIIKIEIPQNQQEVTSPRQR